MPRCSSPAPSIATLPVFLALLALTVAPAAADEGLDLQGERFRVTVEWHAPDGSRGIGQPIPLTQETGLFWFFSPTNVELMVKVLDACPLFQRYWVFASGLTNVDVTLTVEDRWSGDLQRYQRTGGALFAPIADTSSFDACSTTAPSCGHGNSADILASPRSDAGAEALALLLGDDVAAAGPLYERLHADLEAIRASSPSLAQRTFFNPWWLQNGLFLNLTPEAYAAVRAGTYTEWACLSSWYRGSIHTVSSFDWSPWAALTFAGNLHPNRIGPDYDALPGVVSVEPLFLAYPACEGCMPTPGLCAISADGAAYDYFVEDGDGWWYGQPGGPLRVPVRHFRVPATGASPLLVGSWTPPEPQPSWMARLDQCYLHLQFAAGVAAPPP